MANGDTFEPCGRSGCEVRKTKVCAEGHTPPESCPFFGKGSVDEDENEEGTSTPALEEGGASEAATVVLPAGEALALEEVDVFLRGRPITLVSIIGDQDSGKSTLICSIYDRFIRGPFAASLFAGSRTLIGLEKRLHHSREESGRHKPDTPRTSILEGLHFFHLAVVSATRVDERRDIMLSDRAGENYRRARGDSEVVVGLIEVAKADRTVLLLDGGRVIDPVERAGAIHSVRQMLRALLDGGALTAEAIVQVVTTKIDLVRAGADRAVIEKALEEFKTRLQQDFGPRVGELSFWEIAARDPSGQLEPAFGVEALFASWLKPRELTAQSARGLNVEVESEFDRLLLRTRMETGQ
jgi:Double-GTPase 2